MHDYKVKFIEDARNVLKNEIRDGDVIIIDNKVKDLYPDLLKYMNNNTSIIGLDAREDQKSYEGLVTIIQELINSGFRKNHRLIGIGGGIIQDITAFTASIMYRGVSWIFFPTTLLAQGTVVSAVKHQLILVNLRTRLEVFTRRTKFLLI